MYKEHLIYYDSQYILKEKILELLSIIGIEVQRDEFVVTFEDKFYPEDDNDAKVFIYLNEDTQEIFYLDTYIHPSDTLGLYGLGFRCKEDKFDMMINALKDSIERFEERNKVCFEMKEDCLYNVSKKEYVDKDEVPGIYRLRKVEVEKNTF